MFFQGIGRTNAGELKVIVLPAATTIPAGAVVADGLARSSDGYLYVVLS